MSHLTAELLWKLTRVGKPTVAGPRVVVPLTSFDIDTNEGTTSLSLATPEGLRLLTGNGTSPALSPDGSRLAFLRKVDQSTQLHLMPVDGGEAQQVGRFPLGAGSPTWTPDGKKIICWSHVYEGATVLEDTEARQRELAESKVTGKVTEERTYRFWDTWLTDGKVQHVFLVDPEDGSVTDLTPDARFRAHLPTSADSREQTAIHPQGSSLVVAAVDQAKDWAVRPQMELWEIPLDGGDVRCITPDSPGDARLPRFTGDGRVVFGATRELDFYATPVYLTLLDPTTGDQTPLYDEWHLNPESWEIDPVTNRVIMTAEDRSKGSVFSLDLDGGIPEAIAESNTLGQPIPDGLGHIYLLHQSISSPPEVVRVPSTGGPLERVTNVNDEALAGVKLGKVEERWFTGARGDEVQMYVVFPPDFDPSLRYPLLHMIHGGPHNSFGDMWHWRWNYHAFAAPGYVTALVNFHGSSSFGHEFCQCIQGAWGDFPTIDLLAATDLLADEPWIDEGRTAIAGGSYGGYLTTWLATQTDRFKCAVAHAAVTNQGAMYATDSTHGLARARGADLWVDRDAVDRWSPSHHYSGYSTPTLVIHGEKDYRVPINQGLELYGVLKAKGVDARLVYYPDENHWILSPQNSVHWYGEVLGWLARHLT